jgi:hypothetical protein
MEKIRRIVLIGVGILFSSFIIYIIYWMYHGEEQFMKRSYSGVISEIRILKESRDLPDIKINNQWVPLSIDDSKVKQYIQVGDSIVKESGSEIIKVYRKNLKGEWDVQVF